MATFSYNVNKIPGLRFIADALELQSGIGRQRLMKQPFMTLPDEISKHFANVDEIVRLYTYSQREDISVDLTRHIDDLKHALSEIHDINGTLSALHSGMVIDDIGLFEIKRFSLITKRIINTLYELKTDFFHFSNIDEVIRILDPEKLNAPHFYIYNAYSEKLTELRKNYNYYTREIFEENSQGLTKQLILDRAEEIRLQCQEEEDAVRKILSSKLRGYSVALLENMSLLADLDLYLAAANLAITNNLCRPTINENIDKIIFKGLYNPEISSKLKEKNKSFQPVNLEIEMGPSIITGANMAGKSVVLKTVALAQYLLQYGFYIPAISAQMVLVNKIITVMEDEQSELRGLSSFAAEMLKINSIIHSSKAGISTLALIDEPARTTNPQEGLAIVNALVDELAKYQVRCLITTHYSGIKAKVTHLRVAGLKTEKLTEIVSIETINDYMDYSIIKLKEEDIKDVPHEALKIAGILGIDTEMLRLAEKYLHQTE